MKTLLTKLARPLVVFLVVSLLSGNVSGAGQVPLQGTPQTPTSAELQIQTLDGCLDEPETNLSGQGSPFCRSVKSFGTLTRRALVWTVGIGIMAAAIFNGMERALTPICKTIYDPIWNICAFDNGRMVQYNPGEIKRGMYVSIYANDTFSPLSLKYNFILGDETKENQLVDFLVKNQIDSISLYNLGTLFDMDGKALELSNFIIKAKMRGLKEVIAVGNSEMAFRTIADFQKRYPARFDGLLTEVEFWHVKTNQYQAYQDFLTLLRNLKKLNLKNVISGKTFSIGAYFGNLNRVPNVSESEIATSALQHLDRVYQNCYGTSENISTHDPNDAWMDCGKKMRVWSSALKAVKASSSPNSVVPTLIPIYSSEGKDFKQQFALPLEYYSGDWIRAHPSLASLEEAGRKSSTPYIDPSELSGMLLYEYMFLDYYMTLGLTQPAPQSGNTTRNRNGNGP